MLTKEKYGQYVAILKEELVPAMGCTEPISIAYASAKARATLGEMPIGGKLEVSGNIVKNAKSVVVPHTGGMRSGINYVADNCACRRQSTCTTTIKHNVIHSVARHINGVERIVYACQRMRVGNQRGMHTHFNAFGGIFTDCEQF